MRMRNTHYIIYFATFYVLFLFSKSCPIILNYSGIFGAGLLFTPPSYAGNIAVELLRYKTNARSIPVSGEQDGVIGISTHSYFTITEDKAYLNESDGEPVAMGTHLQYIVNVARA